MPCATRGNHTRPDVYGILSEERGCLCAAGLRLATVVPRARGRPSREHVGPGKADTAPKAAPGSRGGPACSSGPGQISPGPAVLSRGGDPPDPPDPPHAAPPAHLA